MKNLKLLTSKQKIAAAVIVLVLIIAVFEVCK